MKASVVLMINKPFSKGAKDSTILDCALKFESTTAFETTPKRWSIFLPFSMDLRAANCPWQAGQTNWIWRVKQKKMSVK